MVADDQNEPLGGHTIVVTGAASGIGLAVTRRCVAQGAHVVMLDRDDSQLDAATAGLGESTSTAVVDVTDEAGIATAFEALGAVTGLVNCAGIMTPGDVTTVTPAGFARCLEVNLTGTFLMTRAAVPHLGATGGSIVNIASVAGLVGIANAVAYCAAKGGVLGMTRALSADLAPSGIRVNAVCPGTVRTPLIDEAMRQRGGGDLDAGIAATVPKYPLGRLGTPDEIAAVVAFLLSDDAAFMTGAIIAADGGMTSV